MVRRIHPTVAPGTRCLGGKDREDREGPEIENRPETLTAISEVSGSAFFSLPRPPNLTVTKEATCSAGNQATEEVYQ